MCCTEEVGIPASVTEVSGAGTVTGMQATSSSPASYVVSAADFSEDSNEALPPIGGEAHCLLNAAASLLLELYVYMMYILVLLHIPVRIYVSLFSVKCTMSCMCAYLVLAAGSECNDSNGNTPVVGVPFELNA